MLDSKLKKIISDKGFKNFWEMYHTLQYNWGYNSIDTFGICLYYFPDDRIWEDVAFIKAEDPETKILHSYTYTSGWDGPKIVFGGIDPYTGEISCSSETKITVGVINEKTKHLKKLFRFYIESCANNETVFNMVKDIEDFENLCDEKYTLELPRIITEYLIRTSKLYFGFSVFKNINTRLKLYGNTDLPSENGTYSYRVINNNDYNA